jgi:hypothetical protein
VSYRDYPLNGIVGDHLLSNESITLYYRRVDATRTAVRATAASAGRTLGCYG